MMLLKQKINCHIIKHVLLLNNTDTVVYIKQLNTYSFLLLK